MPIRTAQATKRTLSAFALWSGLAVGSVTHAQEPGVTLNALLSHADKHSPLLAVARSTRARARAARSGAGPVLPANPELTIALGPRLAGSETSFDLEANLMQQLEIAGERGLRIEAADRLSDLTEAEIEQVRWSVHCDVHAMFHLALVERERALLATRVLVFQEEVLRVVDRQVKAGDAAPLTLRIAEAEVAQAKQLRVQAEQAYTGARIRLSQLTGWPAGAPPLLTGALEQPREPPSYEELMAIAREKLPSLRTGAAAIRAAGANAALADREAWVEPSVGVQYAREGNPGGGPANHVVMGVVSIPIPGFQSNRGERARAYAEVTVANAELNAQRQMLAFEVEGARTGALAAAQRAHAYSSEIIPRFEENLALLQRSFEAGEIDILALSIARERFLRIQSDALGAQLDYFVARAALERVVGADLWNDEQHDPPTP